MNVPLLKAAMVEAGYTQKTLAKALGWSHNTANAKVNGKTPVFVDEACAICDVLHITSLERKVEIFLPTSSQFRDKLN